MRDLIPALLLALALGVAACRDAAPPAVPPAPHPPPPAAARDDAPPVPALSPDEARALALAPPEGSGPVVHALQKRQAAARQDPTRLELWVQVGHAWMQKARADADPGAVLHAEAAAAVVLATAPRDVRARDLYAMVLLDAHRFAEARDLARAVLADAPDAVLAWGALSDALLELGDFDGALEAAQRMVDLKPGLPSYARAAWLRWLGGDVEGARTAYRLAISAGGGAADREPASWVLVEAAETFRLTGDLEGAEAGYALALQHLPDYPPALVGQARVLLARGEAAHAVPLLERALARKPAVTTAGLLATAREAAGDADGAEEALSEAVAIGRRGDGLGLSRLYSERGLETAEALALARAEVAHRGGIATQDALAWALYRAGRPGEARAASDLALAHGTRDARLLYHAGAIRVAQGQVSEGRALIEEALMLAPEFDPLGAPEARRLLARLRAAERSDDGA
ncbi:MAG: tetratricopeptide repeat protein [Deltaproteobacteria bacterium]|nr:tetratricopeptide repeat protein [Deltaproteobacteria bacterium]